MYKYIYIYIYIRVPLIFGVVNVDERRAEIFSKTSVNRVYKVRAWSKIINTWRRKIKIL